MDVGGDVEAYIQKGAVVRTDRSLWVDASDQTDVTALARAVADSGFVALGAAVASPNFKRNVAAHVDGDVKTANGSALGGTQGVFVHATAGETLVSYAAGTASGDDLGVAVSAELPRMDSSVDAYIGSGAHVVATNEAAGAILNVDVRADHNVDLFGFAGGFNLAPWQGVGAAIHGALLTKAVKAHVDAGAFVQVRNDVVVEATSHDNLGAIVVALGAGVGLEVVGSGALANLDKQTYAGIEGANREGRRERAVASREPLDLHARHRSGIARDCAQGLAYRALSS